MPRFPGYQTCPELSPEFAVLGTLGPIEPGLYLGVRSRARGRAVGDQEEYRDTRCCRYLPRGVHLRKRSDWSILRL